MSDKSKLYQNRIIRQLYYHEVLAYSELSLCTGMSLPLVTKVLNELTASGTVTKTGYAPSTGGRKPLMYRLTPGAHYIVSVALDQLTARIAVMDLRNQFVQPIEKFEIDLAEDPNALNTLVEKINTVIGSLAVARNQIIGIGIGIPGFINEKKGISYSFFKTAGKTLSEYLSEKSGLPVFIDNDSGLIALAEFRFGAARNRMNAMVINIGWGVGLGMVLNGELFRGHNGYAGEFSHIPLFLNGKLCSCGKRGCLETETSMLVLLKKAREGLMNGRLSMLQLASLEHFDTAGDALKNAVTQGDQFTIELFSQAGYDIGRGVAVLIHLLNPELIVLSGRGSSAGRIWQAPIQQAINEHCIPRLAEHAEIEVSTLGHNAELIGAAALVIENLIKDRPNKELKTKQRERSTIAMSTSP